MIKKLTFFFFFFATTWAGPCGDKKKKKKKTNFLLFQKTIKKLDFDQKVGQLFCRFQK